MKNLFLATVFFLSAMQLALASNDPAEQQLLISAKQQACHVRSETRRFRH
jgi:hypothetical protein